MSDPKFDQKNQHGRYLQRFGKQLIENGYNIIPIPRGKKGPVIDDWQRSRANTRTLLKWLEGGHGNDGIGILTANTPAVDIDIPDEELSAKILAWCIENLGEAPVRVGKAPKQLLVYRVDEPFKKRRSKVFKNEWEERCLIEVLADGQQFVAFHVHKDTHKPYVWTTEDSPLTMSADDLPLLDTSKIDELFELFESEARARGWDLVKSVGAAGGKGGPVDHDDPFAADVHPVNMTEQEIGQRLMMVPGADDYDTWLQIGMALYHQFEGEEIGREMWHEWSETASNYDREALDAKWDTFDIADKRRAPVTARLILKLAKEAAETHAVAVAAEIRDLFSQATDLAEWKDAVRQARRAEIDHLARSALAEVARDRHHFITGTKIPLPEVKKAIAFELNTKEMPRWCRNWVYDAEDDHFFNTESKYIVSAQGFNAVNDRHAMTKKDSLDGKSMPTTNAVNLALNVFKIPTVHGRRYAPGRDPVFMLHDTLVANTYPENQVPPKPKAIRPVDQLNIKRIRLHLKHLLPDDRERRMFIDWLSYVVQNPGKRVNYAVLLQGVQGDGKSFFAFLLAAVMGFPNVKMLNAHILESSFTGWAVGQCVAALEEIRLIGQNRYEVYNRIKPFITNPVVEIHPKGRDPYNAENTTNYLLFSNYRDALPLSQNERRFLVLFTQWQEADDLRAFKEKNPDYYIDLYGALLDSAPAIRQWLLSLEQDPAFHAQGDAPLTPAFFHMVTSAQSKEVRSIFEVMEEHDDVDLTDELLNITKLQEILNNGDFGCDVPSAKTLEKSLEHAGFWPLGRVRIGKDRFRFYSKKPSLFQVDGPNGPVTETAKIRDHINQKAPPDDDEL